MNQQNDKTQTKRPLARVLARELTVEEVAKVTGACGSSGGNSDDGTTCGYGPHDRDFVQ